MPAIYFTEYDIGYWLLSSPHHLPSVRKLHWEGHPWRDWRTFFTVGKPLLLGSLIFGTPWSIASYFITRTLVARHQRKKHAAEAAMGKTEPPKAPTDQQPTGDAAEKP
jgi:uncharacterized protein (DUF2062 family)